MSKPGAATTGQKSSATTAKSTATAPKKPLLSVGDVLLDKYVITKQIGQGAQGAVFEAKDQKSGDLFAVKIELQPPKPRQPGLTYEVTTMKRLQYRSPHFVRFVDCGKLDNLNFVIMQLVGCNLADLREACPQHKFTESTAVRIALQCLAAIEATHDADFVHRDIKPANFAIGTTKDCRKLYILDFGMADLFKLRDGRMRPKRPPGGFVGTARYASTNAHAGTDLGRVDDMWSWLYMLVEFVKGELPWQGERDIQKVGQLKATSKDDLCNVLQPELERIYCSLQSLQFADEPPYKFYRQLLMEILQKKNWNMNDAYDWEEKGVFYEQLKTLAPPTLVKRSQSKPSVLQEKGECEQEKAKTE